MGDFIRKAQEDFGDRYNVSDVASASSVSHSSFSGTSRAHAPSFELRQCMYNGGLNRGGSASVNLVSSTGQNFSGQGQGNGPIDAVRNACMYAMEDGYVSIPEPSFNIRVEGSGSNASACIQCTFPDTGIVGTFSDHDVVLGCVKAYIHALNQFFSQNHQDHAKLT